MQLPLLVLKKKNKKLLLLSVISCVLLSALLVRARAMSLLAKSEQERKDASN